MCHFIVVFQYPIPKDKSGVTDGSNETAFLLNKKLKIGRREDLEKIALLDEF